MKNIPLVPDGMNYAHTCDVLVVGGGFGGVAAAAAAARAGAKTILLERNTYLGGVATAGHCCSVFNCFYTDDHRLMVHGIPFELTNYLAEKAGPGLSWQNHRGHMIFDVELGKLALHEYVVEAGVKPIFGATLTDVLVEDGAICGVLYTGRNGAEAIAAKRIIDATGDSDAAVLAGAPTKTAHGKSSYCFRVGNVDMDKFVGYFVDHPGEYPDYMDLDWTFNDTLRQYRENGTFLFPHGGGHQLSIVKQACAEGRFSVEQCGMGDLDAMQMHGIRRTGTIHFITGFFRLESLDSAEITEWLLKGKQMAVYVTNFLRDNFPGFENCFLCSTADDLGIRTSRYIDGEFTYTRDMKENPTRFDDSLGRVLVCTNEKLNTSEGAWGAQVLGNDYSEVPLRALLPRGPEGLIMGAGRSISAKSPSLLRVMVNTMVIGQGAGVTAAVSALADTPIASTDYAAIRAELVRQGVYDA
ncbi:MAG: FAD-dependent oxidoreductase [Clostridia bacterium]|nr:FAD-dependent oxidoreductase [Clostridia bacterium]